MKDKTSPIFDDGDTHTSEDLVWPYLCVAKTAWGTGATPARALRAAQKGGLNKSKDVWAIWECIVPNGRIRLLPEHHAITVELPIDMDVEDYDFWEDKHEPQRLRLLGCSFKFTERIIRTRSKRIEARLQQALEESKEVGLWDEAAVLEIAEEILKGHNDVDI